MKNLLLKRKQDTDEEKWNMILHIFALLASFIGYILMLLRCNGVKAVIGITIFFIGMFLLYLFSSLYHGSNHEKKKALFQKFDHLSIYLLIGGTYTPILLLQFHSCIGYLFLSIQWIIILIGVFFNIFIGVHKYSKLHMFLYIALGWSAVFLIPDLVKNNLSLFVYVLIGGLIYSIGIIFYKMKNVRYMHVVWHIFVFLGTFFQYLGIYFYLL